LAEVGSLSRLWTEGRPAERGWREALVFEFLPYGLLGLAVALDFVIRGGSGRDLAINLALAGAAGAWTLVMVTLHPGWTVDRPVLGPLFMAVLVALMAAMVVQAPWFGFYTFSGYLYTFRVLRGHWRLAGIIAVAVIQATSQVGGAPGTDPGGLGVYALVIFFNVCLLGVMMWVLRAGEDHRSRLLRANQELGEVNRRLEAALAEKEGLQRQLLAQAREAGVTDERQRMAREIHDTLAQGLTGIITQLQAAEQAPAGGGEWRRHLDAAARLARESLSEARRSVHAMRPEPLENARLPEALAEVAGGWSALHGVPAPVSTTGDPQPLPPDIEIALLRTAQEALANVARHAHATRVGLTLSYMDGLVTLDVRDDGMGFDPARNGGAHANGTPPGGFGLTAMRDRLGLLAGSLAVESEPGAGTAISASVPVPVRVDEA